MLLQQSAGSAAAGNSISIQNIDQMYQDLRSLTPALYNLIHQSFNQSSVQTFMRQTFLLPSKL